MVQPDWSEKPKYGTNDKKQVFSTHGYAMCLSCYSLACHRAELMRKSISAAFAFPEQFYTSIAF